MLPEIFSSLKNYSRDKLFNDLSAGIIVGIVAIPLAIAFAIASGVSPEKGLITAIIGGFLVSLLGGSKFQIGGPTGAFIVIVYDIIQNYGITGLTIATVMAGVILIIMGLARFGTMIKFIPYPVTVGFTSGIASIIFSAQIKDIFGLPIERIPTDFFEKWIKIAENISSVNYYAIAITLFSLLLMLLWPKVTRKIPGSLMVIILATLIVKFFDLPVETIGSRFGSINAVIPVPNFELINFEVIRSLIQPATAIALLCAIESLLSAVVADGMTGTKHKSDTELIAQGVANIVVPLFGGIPVTGAIARTATNIKNGARTPIAGIVHALTLLLVMLFFGSYAQLIPMAALGAILVVVSYNMSEWKTILAIMKSPLSDIAVFLTTFGLTVIFDLVIAIEIGIILAAFLFIRRMSAVTNVGVITNEFMNSKEPLKDPMSIDNKLIPDNVDVFEVNGPFFFGAAEKFKEAMRLVEKAPRVRIIRMRNVPAIDATGISILREVCRDSEKQNIHLILSGVHAQPLVALEKADLLAEIGEENIFGNIDEALARAAEILAQNTQK